MKKLLTIVCLIMMVASVAFAGAQSKSATGASASSAVMFGPQRGYTTVLFCYATSGDASTELEFWSRTGSPEVVTAAPTNGATVISVDNSDTQFAAGDRVAYVYSDGLEPLCTTLSAADATSITLTDAISQTGTTKDKVYELTENKITINTTAFNPAGGPVFITPKDSPLWVNNDGTTNSSVLVTIGD